jgi:transposase InsO family protein
MHIFESIHQVREKTEEFLEDYINKHPHDSLGEMTPVEFMKLKYREKMPNLTSKEKGGTYMTST